MLILSIETSCDETAVAIVKAEKNKLTTLASVVSSQVKLHAEWGGVVPNLAAREHLKNILPVLDEALQKADIELSAIDLFVATEGPGLIPALLLGVNSAKALSYFHQKPLVGVHHVAGHILSAFADDNFNFEINADDFPLLTLTVSGGHTQLIYTEKPFSYKIIGETQDDAAGEAFDKVAKILDLGYPGGPIISELADEYVQKNKIHLKKLDQEPHDTSKKYFFPRPMINKPGFNFSFSGLKTAVLYHCQNNNHPLHESNPTEHSPVSNSKFTPSDDLGDENFGGFLNKEQISFEFQEAVVDVLTTKTIRALKKYPSKTVSLAGGVAANTRLRNKLQDAVARQIDHDTNQAPKFKMPPLSLTGDNATMIAVAGYYQYLHHKQNNTLDILKNNWQNLDANPNLKLSGIKVNI